LGLARAVTAQFTGEEIIDLTGARLAQGLMPDDAAAVCSDTRKLKDGDWYLALPGRQYDGHDFIGEAYSCGALGCIVEERGSYPIASSSFPLLAVDNTFDAYQQLARNWRKRLNPKVVAVTGSPNESAMVVDACANILRNKFSVFVSDEGSAESLLAAEVNLAEGVQILIA
jgi:UDP-N-acetylmuramoyl-tripeptide--D-alanyl-D-alanine ligase